MRGNRWTVETQHGTQIVYTDVAIDRATDGELVVMQLRESLWEVVAYYAPGAWAVAWKQEKVTLEETPYAQE